jgi:hypothetical protein
MIQAGKTFDSQNVMHAGTTDEAEFFTQQAMGRTNPPMPYLPLAIKTWKGH